MLLAKEVTWVCLTSLGQGNLHPTTFPGGEKPGHRSAYAREDGENVGLRYVLKVKVTGLPEELYVKSRRADTRF